MDIQKQVNRVLGSQLAKLGADTITVDGKKIQAIPAEVETDRELMGGSREEREIDYQFPTIKGRKYRKGMAVQAQGQQWKIDSFQLGKAMTTLRITEPNRIEE